MNYILIDGSYYIFYRYYALNVWWKHACPEDEVGHPYENEEFVEKFKKTFASKIFEMEKKIGITDAIKIVGKDCPRKTIWRNEIFNKYKENRENNTFLGSDFFKMVYQDNLYEAAGVSQVVSYPTLEADDCLAILSKNISQNYPHSKIWIITSDHDYLQLANENITIMNLKYKDLTQSKNSTGDAKSNKFCKIICGDKSDDIPGVFKRCGMKTAMKLYNNPDKFKEKLEKEAGSKERYILNQKLVDFDLIPDELVSGFLSTIHI